MFGQELHEGDLVAADGIAVVGERRQLTERVGLEAAMARLLQDRGYRDQLAQAGRRALETLWSESTVVPRYLDIVRAAAADRQDAHVLTTLS